MQADELKTAAFDMLSRSGEMLARSIQTLDDLLADKINEENNEQSLLLARDIGRSANGHAAAAAFFGFLGVTFLVLAVVLAVAIDPIMLLLLLELIPCGAGTVLETDLSLSAAEGKETFTSFTETGKGFFSDAEEGGVAHDEAEKEKEAEKAPWYWPFGGDGGGEK